MKNVILYDGQNLLAYAEYGQPDGFPILIQHGLIASIDNPAPFERMLSLPARIICIARPGYGGSSTHPMHSYSDWADIALVLADHLGISRWDVLGISSGAPYAYALAARLGGRVRNVFDLSGMPALYDAEVASAWLHPLLPQASITEMQKLARELFFANLSLAEQEDPDIRDSMRNDCFGVAQDLRLRALPWGFTLSDITQPVYKQHSRGDRSVPLTAAERTAQLLPDCHFHTVDGDEHFSTALLNDFVDRFIAPKYQP